MNRMTWIPLAFASYFVILTTPAHAQHLWWTESPKLKGATCLYGEITVLVTHPAIYYCGANWHPGEPAGGYCGIQHNSQRERRTIFSIWDTTPELHPSVTQADSGTIFNRFGGEGEGAHTHMLWNWQGGTVFQYYLVKEPGTVPGTTATRYYIVDRDTQKWRHSATITSPNGDAKAAGSVATIGGGGLGSFLENFAGKDQDLPKIALYRLWLGHSVDQLQCLTQATGDGTWGQLHDAYFLAEGNAQKLQTSFEQLQEKYGPPIFGQEGQKLPPLPDRPLRPELIEQLQHLPAAPTTHQK